MEGLIRWYGNVFDISVGLNSTNPAQVEATKAYLQEIYNQRERWLLLQRLYMAGDTYFDMESQTEKTYATDETFTCGENQRIQELKDPEDETKVIQRWVEQFGLDPNCTIFRLGMTVEQVEAILGV